MECPKVFLVEDDTAIRETFRLCLESEGYGVESFVNGKDALERLRRKPEPCFILLDLMMPVMNGAEFMEEFAKLPAIIVPIPVYLCSATASPAECKALGCRGFVKKPVNLDVLLKIVKDFCQSSRHAA